MKNIIILIKRILDVQKCSIGENVMKSLNKILNPIREFRSFGKGVTQYILMHTIGGVFFSYTIILPVFMNKLEISISEVGIFFGLASIADLVFTYLLRKYFDKISPNTCMALDWFTESWPVLIFAFATTKLHLFIGAISQKLTNILNPAYRVYENEVFPEDKRSLIYTYHLFVPQIMAIVVLPVLGYLLTYKFNSIFAYRVVFFIFGIGFICLSLVPYKVLRFVKPTMLDTPSKNKISVSKNLYLIASAEILVIMSRQFTSMFVTTYFILDKINGDLMEIILIEIITSMAVIITGILFKNIEKYISNEKVCQIGIITFIIYTLIMFLAKDFTMVLVANIINSVGHTLWFPSQSAMLMKFVPEKERGQFFASISTISKFLSIIIPILAGFIISKAGFSIIFAISLFLYVVLYIIYKIILNNKTSNFNNIEKGLEK